MNKYKIIYYLNSDTKIAYVNAPDQVTALVVFYENFVSDDVVSIDVVQ